MTNDKINWNFENSYANLSKAFFTKVNPTPVSSPELIVINQTIAEELGLNFESLKGKEGVEVLAGNKVPQGSEPLAQAYAGHQFGHFTMLGDGRAILLGEQITPNGERFDIQLKGSGETPYSRRGDGRAGLGPMLREYIISEAMYALGIPTTRSLAVVATGEPVYRETVQKGAILTRIAASHIRVGTFEYAAKMCGLDELKALADYTINRHYPQIQGQTNPYLALLKEVIKRQASLITKWQMIGFIHGVMNTDNMAISGETIDYGPCAFMDSYNPQTVFSSIDRNGRYAYGNQPKIAQWNLARLAETLLPLIDNDLDKAVEIAQENVMNFTNIYHLNWLKGMRSKLGIFNDEPEDEKLVENLLDIMHQNGADFTNTFRALTLNIPNENPMFESEEFKMWNDKWKARLNRQGKNHNQVVELLKNSNPNVIPRNHRVEEALDAAEKNDFKVMEKLLEVITEPFAYSEEQDEYTKLPEPASCGYQTFCGT